jgi:thiol-disulfide isomerase/thioredoxin
MNKKILISLFGVIVVFLMVSTSCDKISEPYMENGSGIVTGDTVRKLLFEDFTGHECVNCPSAHKTIEDLQSIYNDRIIVMAEHVGFFARPKAAPFDYDFRTPEGDDISTVFGAMSAPLPKGMVNRTKQNGDYLLDRAAFGTAVSLVLDSMPEKPDIFIEIDPSYSSTDSTLNVDIKLTVLTALPAGKYNIAVMVTESKIVEAQKNNDATVGDVPEILDYEHNHVLRAAINTTWGEEFANGSLNEGQVYTKSYSNFKIGADWNPNNLSIVAFAYFADGANQNVVIQAEEAKLK